VTRKRGIEQGHKIPPEGPEDLFRIARAFQYSKALGLAVEIGLFTELSAGPMTAEELSERTGIEAANLEKLLIVCASMGLLVTEGGDGDPEGRHGDREGRHGDRPLHEGGRFSNSLVADRYLVRGKPEYKGNGIAQTASCWERYDEFGKGIIEQYRAFKGQPPEGAWHQRFIRAMHEFASSGEAQLLADCVDLPGSRHLLDLGGGPGTYAVSFCMKYPNLQATVFDLPETEPIFHEVMDSYGMADRVEFLAGDLDASDFGFRIADCGFDACLVSNMMHGYRGDVIPPKVFEALVPGGLILARDYILYPDRSGPLAAALFNLGIGAYTEDEMIDFLEAAGFVDPDCRELGDHTLITARKPDSR
jgi:hypothetical protein